MDITLVFWWMLWKEDDVTLSFLFLFVEKDLSAGSI